MPDSELEAELLVAERHLQAAQRAGDVAALDRLLDDHLIAIGPDGARYTKRDDLDAYRSGTSVVDSLAEEDLALVAEGTTGATFLLAEVKGTFGGSSFAARLRYMRTWVHDGERGWRVLAAHISPA